MKMEILILNTIIYIRLSLIYKFILVFQSFESFETFLILLKLRNHESYQKV